MEQKDLDKRISELLYEHDCVIIPDFGGFIASYKPAHIHPRLQVIEPPSKSISFNGKLLRNDGLIANYIAEQEGISYDAALAFISSTVQRFQRELHAGKRIEIAKVGVLYLDAEKRIQFQPEGKENFLTASFGLRPAPLQEKELSVQTEATVIPLREKESRNARPWWVAAAAILIPAALVGTFLFQDSFNSGKSPDLAGLNPFAGLGKTAAYSPGNFAVPTVESEVPDSNLPGGDRVHFDFVNDELNENGIAVVERSVEAVASASAIPAPSSALNLYFVIAGAFAVEENAHTMVEDLKLAGFDAALIGKKGRLHLVAYGAYSNHGSAKAALENVKSDNRSAWIYRKK